MIFMQNLCAQKVSVMPNYKQSEVNVAKRDPTAPTNTEHVDNEDQTHLKLKSILVGKTRQVALINDTFVSVGDTIGTAKVVAIRDNSVILLDSGVTITLTLFENNIRKE